MYKIDKTLINNMNQNRSFIVITPKETIKRDDRALDKILNMEGEEQLPPAVREMAERHIEAANEKAQQIIHNARLEAEQIKEAAQIDGYEEGLTQGRNQAAAELQANTQEVRDVLARVESYRQDLYKMLEADILSLSMDIAEKIVNIEINKDDNVFKDIVKKAVAGIRHADDFSVYVSKEDYARYFKADDKWLLEEAEGAAVDVIADSNLPGGSCIIEANSEIVDAGIPMQLGKIGQFLSEQVE